MVRSTLLAWWLRGGLRLILTISYLTSKVDLWDLITPNLAINEWNNKCLFKTILNVHAILIWAQLVAVYLWSPEFEGHSRCVEKMSKIDKIQKLTKLTSETIFVQLILHICLPAVRSRQKLRPSLRLKWFWLKTTFSNFWGSRKSNNSIFICYLSQA